MAKAKASIRPPPSQRQQQQARATIAQQTADDLAAMDRSFDSSSPPPTSDSAAARKKKKKGKGKRVEEEDVYDDEVPMDPMLHDGHHHQSQVSYQTANGPVHLSQGAYAATAQAQADLLATASDLYKRIEADPQGIPDDDAYWTSLPAHLRTFIRNALPLGQFPTTGGNDPNARHASTQAMIAVAQQLAQAAHASQRHLQQYPPGTQPYPSLPFDPAIFADLALHSEQGLPHPHVNGVNPQSPYAHLHYSSTNPPPTQPPGEPLPAPVVLVNEYGEETGDYDDEYYSDEDYDGPDGPDDMDSMHPGHMTRGPGMPLPQPPSTAASKKKNKKKKRKNTTAGDITGGDPRYDPPSAKQPLPTSPMPPQTRPQNPVSGNQTLPPPPPRATGPPPSSRAAGKQPMTFNSNAPPKSSAPNGHSHPPAGKRGAGSVASSHGNAPPPQQPQRIWSTSTAEDRENIRKFWLGLQERERRSLVQVEKAAVLKKMKEQQKHSCSCAVCGRKRSAIESELEVLYSAYFDELQQYATHQQQYVKSGGAIPPPPGPGPFPGSVTVDGAGNVVGGNALSKTPPAQKTRVTAPPKKAPLPPEDDEGYDDELDDEEYDDEYDDEEEEDEEDMLPDPASRRRGNGAAPGGNGDVFPLGSSLTVKGGILTVADDLLKNDGQKFLEMMEQLADRRMQREEDAAAELDAISDDGDEDEEDIEDEEDEEDVSRWTYRNRRSVQPADPFCSLRQLPQDPLTGEQRMEEGRRMFQIFAARLFESRVLNAYREQVAQERQLQLLRELDEEESVSKEKEAKKAKENQKKKDKKKQAQQKKEEERLKRESEKAAEEAAAREKVEQQRAAELKRQEEARAKREAERKQKEEERLKKEEEKRKRLEEERAREAERERKRKQKEEKARQEREAREEKLRAEKEAAEEKQRQEQEAARRAKEEKDRKAKEERDRIAAEKAAAQQAAKAKQAQEAKASKANGIAAAQQPPTSPSAARKVSGTSAAPATPASKSPTTAIVPPVTAKSRQQASVPPSPAQAAPVMYARPPPAGGSATIPARPPVAPAAQQQQTQRSAVPQANAPHQGSSLPAPPQGLPARPTSSKVASQAPPTAAAAASASRPTVHAATAPISPPVASGQQQPSFMNFSSVSPIGASAQKAVAPQQQAASTGLSPSNGGPSPFPRGFGSAGSVFPSGLSPGFDTGRSPTLANGLRSPGGPPGSKPLDGGHSPLGLHSATNALSSLNLGTQPGGFGTPSASSNNIAGPHGRLPSDDYLASVLVPSPSQSSRSAIGRPGPIGPIGRPRPQSELHDEISPSPYTRLESPLLPEGILGSSALGGDDELIAPQPRRTSSTVAPIGGGSSLFGFGGSSSAGGIGAPGSSAASSAFGAASPWGSSSFASPPASTNPTPGIVGAGNAAASGAPSPAFAGLGAGGLSGGGSSHLHHHQQQQPSNAAPGSGGMMGSNNADPWAPRPPSTTNNWDRARYAFEQPSSAGSGLIGQQPQQSVGASQQSAPGYPSSLHQQQMSGGGAMNPFGQRSIFDAPGLPASPVQRTQNDRGY